VTLKLLEEHADESAVEKALKTGEDNESESCPESDPIAPEEDNFLQV